MLIGFLPTNFYFIVFYRNQPIVDETNYNNENCGDDFYMYSSENGIQAVEEEEEYVNSGEIDENIYNEEFIMSDQFKSKNLIISNDKDLYENDENYVYDKNIEDILELNNNLNLNNSSPL